MKLIGKLILFVVVVLVALVLARNIVVKAAVENGVRAVTGMPLSMGKLDIDLSNTFVDIENLVVKNPAGFHDTFLVDIPKILVDYNLSDILKGKVHLENLDFEMSQFTVVKNEQGVLNLDKLKALQGTQPTPTGTGKPAPQPAGEVLPVQIDLMHLKIGKVVFADYSSGQPSTKEFRINIDQSYQNITDLKSVVQLIVLKAMMNSGISNLVNFDVQGLAGSLTDTSAQLASQVMTTGLDTLTTAAQNPGQIAGQAGGILRSTEGTVETVAKDVTSGVKSAASALKSKLKIPF
jgi:hypothetical protein